MRAPSVLLAYLSPETALPLTSIVAAIAGASMLLTRRSIAFLVRCFRGALGRLQRTPRRVSRTSQRPEGVVAP
jgi:hypothetical protein